MNTTTSNTLPANWQAAIRHEYRAARRYYPARTALHYAKTLVGLRLSAVQEPRLRTRLPALFGSEQLIARFALRATRP